jgi:hypothetical protein
MADPAPAAPSEPTEGSEPTTPAASAQVTPDGEAPAVAAPPAEAPQGPIPFDRHQRIVQNVRQKAEQEVGQRFQQQYGAHVELGNRISSDPVGTVVGLIDTLANHPEYGNAVISALARTLGSRRGAAGADAEPQADLQTPDGTLVYSAPQLAAWHQWQQRKFEAQMDQRLQPLQAREEERVAQERMSQARGEAMDRMSKVIAPYKQLLPDWDRHKPALLQKSQEFLQEGYDAQTSLGLAVISVLNTTVAPQRAASQQQQLLATAVAKATGSTSQPGTSVAGAAGRPKDFAEAFSRIRG